ncbi:hypothetical protein T4C_4414 [Trichinella pseudospiralis]|uniref:Uncharacterized protein n=1 Tax=Trichinella pseudospiralis TaxID=6337 RepID=A0A0V1JLP7_TRIPS|nr:hypothetical protein T4C_4414 [Trichinella pseudospiralis]
MNRVPRLSVHSDGILTNVTSMNMLLRSHYSRVTNYMKMVENVSCIQNGRVVRRALFPYFYCLNYKCDEMRTHNSGFAQIETRSLNSVCNLQNIPDFVFRRLKQIGKEQFPVFRQQLCHDIVELFSLEFRNSVADHLLATGCILQRMPFCWIEAVEVKLGKGEVNLSKTEDDEERKIHNCLLCGGKESLLCQHAGFWGVLLRGVWQRFGHCSKMLNNPSCRSFVVYSLDTVGKKNRVQDRKCVGVKVGAEAMTAFGCERVVIMIFVIIAWYTGSVAMRCALSAGLFVKESNFNGGSVSTTAIRQLSFSQHTAAVVNNTDYYRFFNTLLLVQRLLLRFSSCSSRVESVVFIVRMPVVVGKNLPCSLSNRHGWLSALSLSTFYFCQACYFSLSDSVSFVGASVFRCCSVASDDGKQHAAALFDNSTKTLATQKRKPCWQLAWNMLTNRLLLARSCSGLVHLQAGSIGPIFRSTPHSHLLQYQQQQQQQQQRQQQQQQLLLVVVVLLMLAASSGKLNADHFCLFHSCSSLGAKSPPPVD